MNFRRWTWIAMQSSGGNVGINDITPGPGVISLIPTLPPEDCMAIQVHRRKFIVALGGAAVWPVRARAQGKRRVPKIGVLWHAGSAEEEGPLFPALVEGFHKLGYVDGQT